MFLALCGGCRRQYDVAGMKPGERVRCRCGTLVQVPEMRPHEARMLHCSGCGGKLRDEARRCDYCGLEITAPDRNLGPACPECFARLRAGARFCSECGVEIRPEAMRTTRLEARCPRCEGSLVLHELPKAHYTECTACAGIWLDDKSFEWVIEEKDASALGDVVPLSRERTLPPVAADQVKYLRCPTCGTLMNRKNLGAGSGVIFDWCKGHGFWFDIYELERIVAFVNAGGLDRVRQHEIQRTKEELSRLRDQARAAASAGPVWNSEPTGGVDWASLLETIGRLVTERTESSRADTHSRAG